MESDQRSPERLDIGIMNGDVASDFYREAPCTIGYSYVRFEVTGDIKPCCIAKYPMGTLQKDTWKDIWNSGRYEAFREKMKSIHKTRFHEKDPDWGFCQQCSHRSQNIKNNALLQTPFEDELEPENEVIAAGPDLKAVPE